jgi:surface polysaccharide O-acyltransferase-like enzyme
MTTTAIQNPENYTGITEAVPSEASAAKGEEKILFVNAIRVYAMSIVVFIHVAATLAPHYNTINPSDWWISNIYHAFSKGGPPIFTLVSGMLLLGGRDQPVGTFLKKRFLKVLVPFLGWALIYIAWRAYRGESFDTLKIIQNILNGPPYYHLWFIQMILGLYLATPVLRVFVRHARRDLLRYFIGIWVLAVAIIPLLSRFTAIQIGVQFVVMTGFVGYYVLGYYLRDVTLAPKQVLPALLTLFGMILFTELATYALMINKGGNLDDFFLNNQGLNIIVIAVLMFLYLKSLPFEALFTRYPWAKRTIDLLASVSLGVYFVHVMIMEAYGSGMFGFTLNATTFGALIGVPLTALATFVASVVVILILKRIPILNNLVP